jgi:phosphoadenosine phosphosulfate reductase
MDQLAQLQHIFQQSSITVALRETAGLFPGQVLFSTSLGQEDQVLTDLIAKHQLPIKIFTLDTGRLFPETYDTLEKTIARYKVPVSVYYPKTEAVEQMVSDKGINLFYESVAHRQDCCFVRKVEPLNRALEGAKVWITGLRAGQTAHRTSLPVVEWLEDKKIYKINPLLHWTYEEVLGYITQHNVPYNNLHDKGFISIGCAPCTRATEPGEDPRAGRWWWEASHKECGLHLVK